jgi:putative acetyltransferase
VDDCEAVTELVNLPGFRAGTLRLPFQSLEQTKKWLGRDSDGCLNLVAVLDGELIGSAGFNRYAGRRSHVAGLGLGVHDDQRAKGIGTALMGALVEAADNWYALKRLELTVFTDNAPAIRLYEKFGFEPEGIKRAFAFRAGQYADALSMARLRL